MGELTFLVTYITKPGMRETFMRSLAAHNIPDMVRAEEGCLQYDYYLSLQDGNEILLAERWTSPEKQEIHLRQPHMAQMREIKEQYVEITTIRRLSEVE